MFNTASFLADLHRLGIKLWTVGDKLNFEAPKGALTPEIRDTLRQHKAEVLAYFKAVTGSTESTPEEPAYVRGQAPADEHGTWPLTYAQSRIWFLTRLEPDSPAYNLPSAFLIEGPLKPTLLERAYNRLIERHPSLRTSFVEIDGYPRQRIEAPMPTRFSFQQVPAGSQSFEDLRLLVLVDGSRIFDITRAPLFAVTLYQLAPERFLISYNIHHLISDGWSLELFSQDLMRVYAELEGHGPAPVAPKVRYVDYAVWQQDHFASEAVARQLDYWAKQLAGLPPVLDLPTDRPRPPVMTNHGAHFNFNIEADLLCQLHELGRASNTSLFQSLLAAFSLVLARHSGQRDIAVGSTVANRPHASLESVLGLFMNALVLRQRIEERQPFGELLRTVRATTLEAYAHQDVPFEKLAEVLQVEHNLAYTPWFQVALILLNQPKASSEQSELQIEFFHHLPDFAKMDMAFTLELRNEAINGMVEYNTDLFDPTTITRLVGHYLTLLDACSKQPALPLEQLSMLSAAEQTQVLESFNDSFSQPPAELALFQMLERHVATSPDAIAVSFKDVALSYGELNRRANQLAQHLREKGLGFGAMVGIYLERSELLPLCVLAVHKAGAAYLPLDPHYPVNRLAYMIQDSGAELVLSETNLRGSLPDAAVPFCYLDEEAAEIEARPSTNLNLALCALSPAYLIYSSGSTGRPKGILIPHRNLVTVYQAYADVYELGTRCRTFLQMASFSFDVFVGDLIRAFGSGGCLVICPRELLLQPAALVELMRTQQIDHADCVPAVLRLLLEHLTEVGEDLSFLPVLVSGADALHMAEFHQLSRLVGPNGQFYNTYGLTESTIDGTLFCGTEVAVHPSRLAPIGKPFPNYRFYVLDRFCRPLPVGVFGMAHAAGPLASSYLNDPAKTAAAFIPDPFAQNPGERLYKTGDLVRFLPDGNLEFLDRADNQVKIRGFRVELGEIETCLLAHPQVSEAVVTVHGSGGNKRLAAHVVAAGEAPPEVAVLLDSLKQQLPEYMVPSAIVFLDRMPLSPNGKVDRKLLAEPQFGAAAEHSYVAPSQPTELLLAQIWQRVLDVARVGIHDNFFDMGGNSVNATRVISALRKERDVELPLRDLFSTPTIAALAPLVDAAERAYIPPLVPMPREGYPPLSYAQERLWFLGQLNPDLKAYHVPRAMRFSGPFTALHLEQAYTDLIARHEVLRTNFPVIGEVAVQRIHPPYRYRMDLLDLRHLSEPEREKELAALRVRFGGLLFDLENKPLLHTLLIQMADEEHVVIHCEHHMVHDGWTEGILVRDLLTFTRAALLDEPAQLPVLPIQFADFAIWQRKWLCGEVLDEQLAWWRKELTGAPALLHLPTDYPRPEILSDRGLTMNIFFSGPLVANLVRTARTHNTTTFIIMLAGYKAFLTRYTGQTDIVVGTGVANRRVPEVENMIGMVINSLALRTKLDGDPDFNEILSRVRQTCLGAYSHEDTPFAKVVEALAPERSLSYSPLFQVMFAFYDRPKLGLEIPGLRNELIASDNASAKMDLNMVIGTPQTEDDETWAHIELSTDLFEEATVRRLWHNYEAFLLAALLDNRARLSQLPVMEEAERRQLLLENNRTERPFAFDSSVLEAFRAQVERYPDAAALAYREVLWTYAELDARSNQIAHCLRAQGIGLGSCVAVYAAREPLTFAAFLAVLKTGAAYLPLDPIHPPARTAYTIEDSGACLLLFTGPTEPALETSITKLDLNQIPTTGPGFSADKPLGQQPAYVIYTSGSTGRPKGVLIAHCGVANLVGDLAARLSLGPGSIFFQFASPGFDASLLEWASSFSAGALLDLGEEPRPVPDEAFSATLRQRRITHLQLPPSALAVLPDGPYPDLTHVISGGEALSESVRRRWSTGYTFFNAYGPTETTVLSTIAQPGPQGAITIGQPLANYSAYVLDSRAYPQPGGVRGELCVGGPGLALGYMKRPAQTASSFIPNAFSSVPGARLYRTGDLVSWCPNGQLAYHGRFDHQVKLRGFRIEPGEIEAVLQQHHRVAETCVLLRPISGGDSQLLAFVRPALGASTASSEELLTYLGEHLPAYMVPAALVLVERFPLNSSGKVDRSQLLAEHGGLASRNEAVYVAPRTPAETKLTEIFQEVLAPVLAESYRVGVHDNFFHLGGHSLLATKLTSRVKAAFGQPLPLRRLFEKPSVAQLVGYLDSASANVGEDAPPILALDRAPEGSRFPVSFGQSRLWFLHQMDPTSATYHIPVFLKLSGPLHLPALAETLAQLVQRHEILRTSFADSVELVQQICPNASVPLRVIDLRGQAEAEARAQTLLALDAQRPFDLRHGPLLRVMLVPFEEQHYLLAATMHHIISDGWSMGVFVRELTTSYRALVADQPPQQQPLVIQYADYSVWQRSWLQGEVLAQQMTFWRNHLRSAPQALDLPTDRPRPATQTFAGDQVTFNLDGALTQRLKTLAETNGGTPFMLWLAIYQVLLCRYSNQKVVVVGCPIANRQRPEVENLIGFFVNSLALATDLSSDPKGHLSFRQLLARVVQNTLAAFAHQDLPFEKLVEELLPQRDPSRSPLFQVAFSLQEQQTELTLPGIVLEPFITPLPTSAKFDLTLTLAAQDVGMSARLNFNSDLFDRASAARMSQHFVALAEALLAAPDADVFAHDLLSAEERQTLLHDWNQTATSFAETTVYGLLNRAADRFPDHQALHDGQVSLTYAALQTRANRLAHYLRSLGVQADSLVAVCESRSIELIVHLRAILQAGAAYVPLDPNYPTDRLAYMLADSRPVVLIADAQAREHLPPQSHTQVLHAEDLAELVADQPEHRPACAPLPGNLAYTIYTSGSTGKPKGAANSQRGLANHIGWMDQRCPMQPGERMLHKAAFSFDASVWEIFWPLSVGATVVPAAPDRQGDTAYLAELIEHASISHALFVPSVLAALLAEPSLHPAGLRAIYAGGEALPTALARSFFKTLPGVTLYNFYGPTEAAIGVTLYHCDPAQVPPFLPIGTPGANIQIQILDRSGRLQPLGLPGELHIGGAALARGYHARPGLTAEKFIPADDGQRCYKTGDLARWLPSGQIQYLGRIDHQVKLRGLRIELAEIESVLSHTPGVAQAVVLVQNGGGSHPVLVAYLVAKDGFGADASLQQAVLTEARQQLPHYMVPTYLEILANLPLQPNGKVDRNALAARVFDQSQAHTPSRALVGLEIELAAIWAEVLGRDSIAAHDNFFQLGGHSLLATRVVSRVREQFQLELALRLFFEKPVLADLAEALDQLRARAQAAVRPGFQARRPEQALPLSFAQTRLWFLVDLEGPSATYNIPIALRLQGPLQRSALTAAILEIVARHEVLRTSFVNRDGLLLQRIHPAGFVVPKELDLRELAEPDRLAQAAALAETEGQRPFDLAEGPLFRVQLLTLADEDHILLANMHHSVSDGWSMGIFIRELTALYQAFCAKQPSPLAALPWQYADFALWQRDWLRGEALERQLGFWREYLAAAPASLDLPTDLPRPAVQTFRGGRSGIALDGELAQSIQALAQQADATPFMLLLAAFQVLLGHYSGQSKIVVGTPIANRNQREVEALIGFFVNTLALATDLTPGTGVPNFAELLTQVRANTLAAYDHQDLPFEKLVEELHTTRDLSRSPIFQVMCSMMNAYDADLTLPGLRVSEFASNTATVAKFDLSLALQPDGPGYQAIFTYNRDLFHPSTIAAMAQHFRNLLQNLIQTPQARIDTVTYLDAEERQLLLQDWSRPQATSETAPRCIHQLLAQTAARQPESLATLFLPDNHQGPVPAEHQRSYGQLSAEVQNLAAHLRRQGVGPENVVGLYCQRSTHLLVALLAVLEAGAAYLPLDPAWPIERLETVLADAAPALVLSETGLIERLSGPTLRVDQPFESVACSEPAVVDPANLAYLIYTSGSTGKPKGVAVCHASLTELIHSSISRWVISPDDRFLHLSSFTFDAAIYSLFTSLCAGAALYHVGPETPARPDELARFLKEQEITHVFMPTPVLAAMPYQHLPALRCLLVGGDALSVELKARWQEGRTLYNDYGPTETTIMATTSLCVADGSRPTIGRPITSARAYILDRQLLPTAAGVPGELVLGGTCVSRGYYGQAALTAARFLPDPYSDKPGTRFYVTGDRVRFLMGGELPPEIDFLGRLDFQVKIRGYRIEPGEVAACLESAASVAQAVVLCRTDANDHKRLIAYIVPSEADTDEAVFRAELNAFLKDRLPVYMVPAALVLLPQLPLNRSGKLDRAALERMALPEELGGDSFSPPRNATEEALVAIWAEVLALPRVGIHDNFFELGGHSLLATRLMARVTAAFERDLPLKLLFQTPTVAALAALLQNLGTADSAALAIPALSRDEDQVLPLSFMQQRLWFVDRLEGTSAAYHMPTSVRIKGELDPVALERALFQLVERHEVLRSSFPEQDGSPRLQLNPAQLCLEFCDVSDQPEQAERLAEAEAKRPFSLAHGPLIRALLLRTGQDSYLLQLVLHHIVSDGWSQANMIAEIVALYRNEPASLPKLVIQYADFAVWQQQRFEGEELERQLGWWQRHLAGPLPALDLALDGARSVGDYRGASLSLTPSKACAQALEKLARDNGATLFMVLLTSFQLLLHRLSGQDDIIVGTPVAGRPRQELEPLIGCFLNTLPLRTRFPESGEDFLGLLARVRSTTLEALAHGELPFEQMVGALKPERRLDRHPIFDVLFNFINLQADPIDLPRLRFEPLRTQDPDAKFELSLYVHQVREGGLGLNLVYRESLFSQTRMALFLEQYRDLLEQIAAQPSVPHNSYSLIPASCRALLPDPSLTLEQPYQMSVVAQVLQQAKARPEAIALELDGRTWTYAELVAAAEHLARSLKGAGLEPGQVVAVTGPSCFGLVASVLACLWARAVLLTLDPNLPPQRRAQMLARGEARLALDCGNAEDLPGALRVDPESGRATLGLEDAGPLEAVEAEDPAYLFFTSGSTGEPKAVLGQHKSLAHFINWQRQQFEVGPEDRVAQMVGLSFDAVLRDIFLPLSAGACLVLPTSLERIEPLPWFASARISLIHAVPSLLGIWLEASPESTDLAAVRCLFFAGEPLRDTLVARCRARFAPGLEIVNFYGATETTLIKTFQRIEPTTRPGKQLVGRALPQCQVLVLSPEGRLCGPGEAGQVVVRTPFRSKGYLGGEPVCFQANPATDQVDDLLYPSGDLGRYMPDGSLELLGRLDHQVKILGVRIEPGEIEAALEQLPQVDRALVSVVDHGEHKQLVAHLTAAIGQDRNGLKAEVLRGYLSTRFAQVKIPQVFHVLDSLPLLPSGKVDRAALARLQTTAEAQTKAPFVAPSSPNELTLAEIWLEVLGLAQVGIHDNFFELGGHSLLVTRTLNRIQEAFQVSIPLRRFFETATIATLEPLITEQQILLAGDDEVARMLAELENA